MGARPGSKEFQYRLPQLGPNEFPVIQKPEEATIRVLFGELEGLEIIGNSAGLLHLARFLVAMGLHRAVPGFHVHMEPGDELDEGSLEVEIRNIDSE